MEPTNIAGDVIRDHTATKPSAEVLKSFRFSPMPGGNNPKCRAEADDGRTYVVKWSKNNLSRVPEINRREMLISILGRLVGVGVVDAWVVRSEFLPEYAFPPDEPQVPLIRDECVVMPFLQGSTVAQSKPASAIRVAWNASAIADLFAFMHWIGDEDRGVDDVMLIDDRFVLIDNGLCGPGAPESGLRGYHPNWEDFRHNSEAKVKKCYPGKPSFVAFVLRDLALPMDFIPLPSAIDRIMTITDEAIREIATHCRVASSVSGELIHRKAHLAIEYREWFSQALALPCIRNPYRSSRAPRLIL